jgi:hypothetical protein
MQDLYSLIKSGEFAGSYMFHIAPKVGRTKINLESEQFKTDYVAQSLRENGVRSKDVLPFFEVPYDYYKQAKEARCPGSTKSGGVGRPTEYFGVEQAYIAMRNMLPELQRQMTCGGEGRWWFFTDVSKPDVERTIAKIKQLRDDLVEDLLMVYDKAQEVYEHRVRTILDKVGAPESQIQEALDKFLTKEEIRQNVRLSVEGPIAIPRMADIAKISPEFQSWIKSTHESLAEELPQMDSKLCGAMAAYLERLYKIDPTDTRAKSAKVVELAARESRIIAEMVQLRRQIIPKPDQLDHDAMAVLSVNTEAAMLDQEKAKVRALQSVLVEREYLKYPASRGHKELAAFVGMVSMDDRYAMLLETIAKVQNGDYEHDTERQELLRKIETEYRVISQRNTRRISALGVAVEQLIGISNITIIQEIPEAQEILEPVEPVLETPVEVKQKRSRAAKTSAEVKPKRVRKPAANTKSVAAIVVEATESVENLRSASEATSTENTSATTPAASREMRQVQLAGF